MWYLQKAFLQIRIKKEERDTWTRIHLVRKEVLIQIEVLRFIRIGLVYETSLHTRRNNRRASKQLHREVSC